MNFSENIPELEIETMGADEVFFFISPEQLYKLL